MCMMSVHKPLTTTGYDMDMMSQPWWKSAV